MKQPICTAILVAAGKGRRMGTEISKQFLPLCGKEILAHTMAHFEQSPAIRDIILVIGGEMGADIEAMEREYGWKKLIAIATGGRERQDSVWSGLQQLPRDTEIVLIHDGVRPFVTAEMIENSIQTAWEMGACVVGVPAKDTIKICDAAQMAIATPDRNSLWQIQTPQTFRTEIIREAYEKAIAAGFSGTDDASVAEFGGNAVRVILGDYRNIKITTREDLLIGEVFLRAAEQPQKPQELPKTAAPKQDKTVIIYTDGACSGNPGAGGYGIVLLYGTLRKELSAGFRKTTNNRMELLAVIKGLDALKEPCRVQLYSDSKYVVDAMEKGWVLKWQKNGWMRNKKERASNVDLWERLLPLLEKHRVSFHWVKGHADNPENERCDELARAAIQSGNLQDDEMYGIL